MIEKLFALFMKLSSPRIPVPLDKQAHFNTGAILALVTYFFIGYWALLLVAIVAGAKEWDDCAHPNHTADVWDWIATVAGALISIIVLMWIK